MKIEHASAYLPYNLTFYHKWSYNKNIEIVLNELGRNGYAEFTNMEGPWIIDYLQPILVPISDFDYSSLSEVKEFVGNENWCQTYDNYFDVFFLDALNGKYQLFNTPYPIFQYFLSKHFDVFGLIDSGIAVNRNTLHKQNHEKTT